MSRKKEFILDYDKIADVMYITLYPPVPSEGEENKHGIEIDYSIENGFPCGMKIIGYKRYGWTRKADTLASCFSNVFKKPKEFSSRMIEKANKKAIEINL